MKDQPHQPSKIALITLPLLLLLIMILLAIQPTTAVGITPAKENIAAKTEPSIPPDSSKISVSKPDVNGQATITGAAGAVPGNVWLAIINLSARSATTAAAGSSGAFKATLFAPPGSSVLLKYSQEKWRIDQFWQHAFNPGGDFAYMTPLPGTMMSVPGTPDGPGGVTFNSAGFLGPYDGPDWAGWWLSGVMSGGEAANKVQQASAAQYSVKGTLWMTSPALNCAGPQSMTPKINFALRSKFGADGQALIGNTWFNAYLFTPTGLPIEHEVRGEIRGVGSANVTNLVCQSKNTLKGEYTFDFTLPAGLNSGQYQLEGWIKDGGIPLAGGLPLVTIWHHSDSIAFMPLITVGKPDAPRIPWTLFANYTTNGHRGVQAVQDRERYQLVTRTIFAPERVVLPKLDARSGKPITYRLEPGSNWLSSTDRRFPNPLRIPLLLPGGVLRAEIHAPDGSQTVIGPAPVKQSSVWTPSLPDGSLLYEGTGHAGDIYHLFAAGKAFAHSFEQYGPHTIHLDGHVKDLFGNEYPLEAAYEIMVARVLDLDPAQLPTTPYQQGDYFAPGLHIFPPVPANVTIKVLHLPFSDPGQAQEMIFSGRANRFGVFEPTGDAAFRFEEPGEFRVDIAAEYEDPDGTLWAGYVTWGNVVEGMEPLIEAHGRRGMDYASNTIDDMPAWFQNANLPLGKMGIENYYPYFSGDIHWGEESAPASRKGDSIHTIITLRDLTGSETIYNLLRQHYPRATNKFRFPPVDVSQQGLEKRIAIGEAPLFLTTTSGKDPAVYPQDIDMWGYWYGSSERPDVHVREIISEDDMGTAYWRFNDTYGQQIGEPADGDQPGDIKWEFGGIVFRVPPQNINEYAIYSSLWVMLPEGCDDYGCTRVTPPFQDATGASINGGPILELLREEIDMLFLPKAIRPGDILELGDTVAFSGHVGPPLDSRVNVVITSPSGKVRGREMRANKIGWIYDPDFNFTAAEPGRWTVEVRVIHDRPYIGNGVTPTSHNTGTVLGTKGKYSFYVVEPGSPRLALSAPDPGFLTWPNGKIEPLSISGQAPPGTKSVHYTIHDKGIVMGQGTITPQTGGRFQFTYDPVALHKAFSMLSLTAREGRREGLADEVTISFLAEGRNPQATAVTLLGEEVFAEISAISPGYRLFLPAVRGG